MNKDRTFIDKITTSGIECPKIVLPDSVKIDKQNVRHGTKSMNCYVPIELKISYHITNAKIELEDLKKRNSINGAIRKYIKQLKEVIYLMKTLDNSIIKNEELDEVHLIDGCTEDKMIALESYKRQKVHAEEILKSRKINYKSAKKEILKKCQAEVTLLLKNNISTKPALDTYEILVNNGIDIPINF